MIVTDDEALSRINSPDNLVNKIKGTIVPNPKIVIDELHKNRTGPKNIPPMVQTLAVALAQVDSQKSSAEAFGMTPENLSYLTHKGKKVDRDLVKESVSKVHSKALDAMLESIDLLGPKLKDVRKATDLANIAANLGRVIEKTSPKEGTGTNVKVMVYAPNQKVEADYEQMDA